MPVNIARSLPLVLLSFCSVLSVLLAMLALLSSPTLLPAPRDRAGSPPASDSIFPPNFCEFLTVEGCGVLCSHSSWSLSRRHGFSCLQLRAPWLRARKTVIHILLIWGSWEAAKRRGLLEVACSGQERADSVLWYPIPIPFHWPAVPALLSDLSVREVCNARAFPAC